MDVSTDRNGDAIFSKQIMVDESSEIQYKFRHASGDWWALDPDADTGEMDLIESEHLRQGFLYVNS
jgi:hypothetical protein